MEIITREEAQKRIARGGVTLVDVRTPEEYRAGHVEGAINIRNESIGTERPEELPDLNAQIILYCLTGIRARDAMFKLSDMGYTNVASMGGISGWDLVR